MEGLPPRQNSTRMMSEPCDESAATFALEKKSNRKVHEHSADVFKSFAMRLRLTSDRCPALRLWPGEPPGAPAAPPGL